MDPNSSQTPSEPDQPEKPNDAPQPVAYDTEGRPLYAEPLPPSYRAQSGPQFVHLSRAVSPEHPPISDEVKAKHDESARIYPSLNMTEAEYIVSVVPRHPIGLLFPIVMVIFLIALVASSIINYPLIMSALGIVNPPAFNVILGGGLLLILILIFIGYMAVWIYNSNRFYLTNESVIQEIQTGLFNHNEQTVSLANIEDASFTQDGILQNVFNYGSIRLSTEGDETTYRFTFVARPKDQIAILNNAVEAFKNGRPAPE
jgi:uncharacterized membrane protein YdbT with pleckstrin-like domain